VAEAGYIYDQAWHAERERLAGIEAMWDPGTERHCEALGLVEGWRCLEVGAGGGAIVEWLARRVGPGGRVVATDLDTRFLDALDAPNVEVHAHDVLAEAPFEPGFDLVHARLLLEHLPRRQEALERMAGWLAPAGWLLLEDYDWPGAGVDPPSETYLEVMDAVLGFMSEVAGFDAEYGRRLPNALRNLGLDDVGADGRVRLLRPGDPGIDFFRLSLEALRGPLVEQGRLDEAAVEEALAMFERDDLVLRTPAVIAAWGRARAAE
jgi:SAM-dependent methyltransferase